MEGSRSSEMDVKSVRERQGRTYGRLHSALVGWFRAMMLLYSMYGIIRYKIKFTHHQRLLRCITLLTVTHSWYLFIKFTLIFFLTYKFNAELKFRSISLSLFNCSLANDLKVLELTGQPVVLPTSESSQLWPMQYLDSDRLWVLSRILDWIGGPYIFLGNMAFEMYGFYAMSFYAMLAIFPIELIHKHIRFNYYRFVLDNSDCMRDMAEMRLRIVNRMAYWKDQSSSRWTSAMFKFTKHRKLRCEHLFGGLRSNPIDKWRPVRTIWRITQKDLRERLRRDVQLAHDNLSSFKPHVRDEDWARVAKVATPLLIIFYVLLLFVVIANIYAYTTNALRQFSVTCARDLLTDLPTLDWLVVLETKYSVFAIAWSAGFYYCYYFGTMLEIKVWIFEIMQQMSLSKEVIKLVNLEQTVSNVCPTKGEVFREYLQKCRLQGAQRADVKACFNRFGGINSLWAYIRYIWTAKQSDRLKRTQFMALQLMSERQTLYRATYLNLQLFLMELKDSRFMVETILKRTAQISCGCALIVSMAKTQFDTNYLNLKFLLFSSLFTLNIYIISAASVDQHVKSMMSNVNAFFAAKIEGGSDLDLLDFWFRESEAFEKNTNAHSYVVYSNMITWWSVPTFNGLFATAYLLSVSFM